MAPSSHVQCHFAINGMLECCHLIAALHTCKASKVIVDRPPDLWQSILPDDGGVGFSRLPELPDLKPAHAQVIEPCLMSRYMYALQRKQTHTAALNESATAPNECVYSGCCQDGPT